MIKLNMLYIRILKQTLTHGLVFKKVLGVIKFSQKARLKPYVDMNTDLREETRRRHSKSKFAQDSRVLTPLPPPLFARLCFRAHPSRLPSPPKYGLF